MAYSCTVLLVAVVSMLCVAAGEGGAREECGACVAGWCRTRKTLVGGFHVTDQLAIDHAHNVLYLQLNSNLNTAIHLSDLKIHVVQTANTSGMTVDQATHDLYTADYEGHIYRLNYGSDTPILYSTNRYEPDVDLLFYKDHLYYTSKHTSVNRGINYIKNTVNYAYIPKLNQLKMNITDFVVDKDNKVFYVANNKVYVYVQNFREDNTLVVDKPHVLSTDKNGKVYLADSAARVIYKLNEANELEPFAAYQSGSVDRFVFDRDNNVVFHDATDDSVATWRKVYTRCTIHPPQTHYSFDEISTDTELSDGGDEIDETADVERIEDRAK